MFVFPVEWAPGGVPTLTKGSTIARAGGRDPAMTRMRWQRLKWATPAFADEKCLNGLPPDLQLSKNAAVSLSPDDTVSLFISAQRKLHASHRVEK